MSISLDKNHLQENVWWKLITWFVYQNIHMKLAVPLIFIVYLTYFQNAAVSFECFWKSFSWHGSCYEKCVIEQVSRSVTKSLHFAFSFCKVQFGWNSKWAIFMFRIFMGWKCGRRSAVAAETVRGETFYGEGESCNFKIRNTEVHVPLALANFIDLLSDIKFSFSF